MGEWTVSLILYWSEIQFLINQQFSEERSITNYWKLTIRHDSCYGVSSVRKHINFDAHRMSGFLYVASA